LKEKNQIKEWPLLIIPKKAEIKPVSKKDRASHTHVLDFLRSTIIEVITFPLKLKIEEVMKSLNKMLQNQISFYILHSSMSNSIPTLANCLVNVPKTLEINIFEKLGTK
jgi:hypothetical protein